jgi:hypothetical protein
MKRSLVWGGAAVAALVYLGAMVLNGALPELGNRVKFEAQGVMLLPPERIDRVEIRRGAARLVLLRSSGGWAREGGDALSVPLADKVALAVQYMHTSGPVRVMAADEIRGLASAEFGLAEPQVSVTLFAAGTQILQAHFGARNPDDMLQYMALAGQDGMYLMSRFVGNEWGTALEAIQPR